MLPLGVVRGAWEPALFRARDILWFMIFCSGLQNILVWASVPCSDVLYPPRRYGKSDFTQVLVAPGHM